MNEYLCQSSGTENRNPLAVEEVQISDQAVMGDSIDPLSQRLPTRFTDYTEEVAHEERTTLILSAVA